MEVLNVKTLKELLKGLDLNYLEGEKKNNILTFTEQQSNKDFKKAVFVNYKPCEVVEIEKDKYYLVFAEMEDVEENFIFSTTAFLITEANGHFNYETVLIGVRCNSKLYNPNDFFNSIRIYNNFFTEDMTENEIHFLVRDDIGEKAHTLIFNIFKIYANKMFDNLVIDRERENTISERVAKYKGGVFFGIDLENFEDVESSDCKTDKKTFYDEGLENDKKII